MSTERRVMPLRSTTIEILPSPRLPLLLLLLLLLRAAALALLAALEEADDCALLSDACTRGLSIMRTSARSLMVRSRRSQSCRRPKT